jgi:DNA topoisomerase-1
LVKVLEELGIGRPSTYASIISTLQDRGYVRLEERRFFPEDVGEVVTDLLKEFFPDVVDVNFTAKMEEDLDEIAEGTLRWVQVLDEFYGPFERLLEKNEGEIQRFEEVLDETCPLCPQEGRTPGQLVIKLGRYGKFIGCSNWPDCSYIRNIDGQERKEPEVLEETCPECGKPLAKKWGRFGPFIGCTGYPECRYIKREEQKTGVKCPKCGQGDLVVKRARRGKRGSLFYGCNRYPECDFTVGQRPVPDPCPSCGSLMVQQKDGTTKCTGCGIIVGAVAESAAEG